VACAPGGLLRSAARWMIGHNSIKFAFCAGNRPLEFRALRIISRVSSGSFSSFQESGFSAHLHLQTRAIKHINEPAICCSCSPCYSLCSKSFNPALVIRWVKVPGARVRGWDRLARFLFHFFRTGQDEKLNGIHIERLHELTLARSRRFTARRMVRRTSQF